MNINAGNLDRQVEIWSMAEGMRNNFNEPTMTPTKRHTVWAAKIEREKGLSDNETLTDKAQVIVSDIQEWMIRYLPNISTKHWLIVEGLKYNIVAHPVEIGRRKFLRLVTQIQDNETGS